MYLLNDAFALGLEFILWPLRLTKRSFDGSLGRIFDSNPITRYPFPFLKPNRTFVKLSTAVAHFAKIYNFFVQGLILQQRLMICIAFKQVLALAID